MIARQKPTHRFLSGLLPCATVFASVLIASCTASGTGSDGQQLQLSTNGSLIAETLQSAAEETVAAEEKATSAPEPTTQVAMLETSATPETEPVIAVAAKEDDAAAPSQQLESEQPVTQPIAPTALFSSPKPPPAFSTAPQKPANPQSSQGSVSRLFSGSEKSNQKAEKPVIVAVSAPASSSGSGSIRRDYSYTLPGVRANGGIEIKHRNSIYDDSNIDADESDDFPTVQLASAPGLARLAPNGLRVQRETVDVACLKPQLVTMLKSLERHYRRPVMVTSGYRSPAYNQKVRGASKSLHMICAAADIQIDGVHKSEIARHIRALPGRGGVGTYCHTKSVHVDIGPERDWNWRCSKRS